MITKPGFTPLGLECSVSQGSGRFARSIAAGDDHTALRLANQHPDQQLGWAQLADVCTRRIWLHQGRPLFGQLMALPVIHEARYPHDRPPILNGSSVQALTAAVNRCLNGSCVLLLFPRLRNYACVSTWSPLVLEEHLRCVHDRQLLAPCYEQKHGLLAGGTQLSFLFAVIVSRRSWPGAPVSPPGAISELRAVIAPGLGAADGKRALRLQVLHPQPIQEAIASGICAWIARVHAERTLRDWRAIPIQEPLDTLRVDVDALNSSGWIAGFNVRKHQVGMRGLQAISYALDTYANPGGATVSSE